MAFGDSVKALLETYSNCLRLLKSFNRKGKQKDEAGDGGELLLRESLKSDRASVRRAYAAGLGEAGSRFERGDGKETLFFSFFFLSPSSPFFLFSFSFCFSLPPCHS